MPRRTIQDSPDVLEELYARLDRLERQVNHNQYYHRILASRIPTASYPLAIDGQIALEEDTGTLKYYANDAWHEAGSAKFHIKVVPDSYTFSTGDGAFIFAIPEDLNGQSLLSAHAYVTTVSTSGLPTVRLRNLTTGNTITSTNISIDVNEFTSYTATTPPVINPSFDQVSTADRISIDVTVSGSGAKGLGVLLGFG
jgi:hypothetical protein